MLHGVLVTYFMFHVSGLSFAKRYADFMHFLKIAKELQKTLENTHIMDTPIWADDRTNKKPD